MHNKTLENKVLSVAVKILFRMSIFWWAQCTDIQSRLCVNGMVLWNWKSQFYELCLTASVKTLILPAGGGIKKLVLSENQDSIHKLRVLTLMKESCQSRGQESWWRASSWPLPWPPWTQWTPEPRGRTPKSKCVHLMQISNPHPKYQI